MLAINISANRLLPINLPQNGNISQTHLSDVKINCLILKIGYTFSLKCQRQMLWFECKMSPVNSIWILDSPNDSAASEGFGRGYSSVAEHLTAEGFGTWRK